MLIASAVALTCAPHAPPDRATLGIDWGIMDLMNRHAKEDCEGTVRARPMPQTPSYIHDSTQPPAPATDRSWVAVLGGEPS